MSNHTPGPWVAKRMPCQTDSHTYNSEVVTAEGGECVASLLRKADAQLIAAAPELLAACQAFIDAKTESELNHAAVIASAAIAYAKGER
jgi:dihydrofolate reductase